MITDTTARILDYIATNKQARPHELGQAFHISQVAIHKQINKLLREGKIQKVGKPPLVFYVIAQEPVVSPPSLSEDISQYIEANYLYISPQGEMIYGVSGFTQWVQAIHEERHFIPLAKEYVLTHQQAESHRSSQGWIEATEKMQLTFKDSVISHLLYADFYSIPKFGKTKLGQLVLYAKQSQNRALIDLIVKQVRPVIERIIEEYHIDMLGFIPPSVPRRLQFMKEFANHLQVPLPVIELAKLYKGNVVVAQKTLSRLEERVTNARETIFTKSTLPINAYNILLLDDAVGSGATLNETAKKIQMANLTKKNIIAFSIVGSMKGFEVIREV